MSSSTDNLPPASTASDAFLRRGQMFESEGKLPLAIAAYDAAISLLRSSPADEAETRRQLGVAWMNRGNALQKSGYAATSDPDQQENLSGAVAAYDQAVALFQTLPSEVPDYRNHLGAACLNRGHALLATNDHVGAIAAFEQAITHLKDLPLDETPAYRLNLAGAWTNLAHTELSASPERARTSAQNALSLVAAVEQSHLAFADMSLRARRALVMALGAMLDRDNHTALLSEATDAIEDGLALGRDWEQRDTPNLRPLALRLFRLGAQLYRMHQPQFLAEFLLENLDPGAQGSGFATDAEFHAVANEALVDALEGFQRPQLLVQGTPHSDRVVAIASALRSAQQRLAHILPA